MAEGPGHFFGGPSPGDGTLDEFVRRCLCDFYFSFCEVLLDKASRDIDLFVIRRVLDTPFLRYRHEDSFTLLFRKFFPALTHIAIEIELLLLKESIKDTSAFIYSSWVELRD